MIGLDTNVVVRYLVADDPKQTAAVRRVVDEAVAAGTQLFLNTVILCELAWVLEGAYGFGASEVADAIEALLRTRQVEVEDRDVVWRSLARYRSGRADFADYVVGEKNRAAPCEVTVTLDRVLEGEAGFRLV